MPILVLVFSISNYGQIKTSLNENYTVSKIEKKLNDINVQILQYKLKTSENTSFSTCRAKINIFKNSVKIDSISFSEIEPVGANYGLMIYNSIIENHLIITKYGDYKGLTIIINDSGKIFNTNGGFVYIDRSRKLLFSISASDLFGISVFNLKSDVEIIKKYDLADEPVEFYKSTNGKYFFKATSLNSEKDNFYEIHFKNKTITKVDIESNSTEYQKLEKLIDWENVKNINCE